ncbi:hypothetical protein FVE85_1707 [Porphyridium purpureum]|uniref:Uncharacterized protein n=1 Tax=Porphyridium purpureum TaxID=35688 RepID=A0A5J4YXF2_PORPP|nr:hypothetical protein FVE85_1707 [Porphyridium purpureum]|eukprot:POR8773..scf209_3
MPFQPRSSFCRAFFHLPTSSNGKRLVPRQPESATKPHPLGLVGRGERGAELCCSGERRGRDGKYGCLRGLVHARVMWTLAFGSPHRGGLRNEQRRAAASPLVARGKAARAFAVRGQPDVSPGARRTERAFVQGG